MDVSLQLGALVERIQLTNETSKETKVMKYILMMSGTQTSVARYQTWSQSDRDTHMQGLGAVVKGLMETGEFVDTALGRTEGSQIRPRREERAAGDGWRLPRIQGVSAGLLDRRCGHTRARLRHRCPDFGCSRAGRHSDEYADRGTAVPGIENDRMTARHGDRSKHWSSLQEERSGR